MDLSPLIFVALAVAWAVYLVPQALKHHDEVVRNRSVDRFSHTMRVLARREPVGRSSSRLVVTPGRIPSAPVVTTKPSGSPEVGAAAGPAAGDAAWPVPASVRREAARRAARRRRRVLLALLTALVAVVVLASTSVVTWAYVVVPASLLVAWLVACRLMVRRERGISGPLSRIPDLAVDTDAERELSAEETGEVAVVGVPLGDPLFDDPAARTSAPAGPVPSEFEPRPGDLWEPVPVTLPTYVSKPAAERRSVRTIDLDATGVWTSGRTDADSALVREAEQQARRDEGENPGRAVVS